MPIILTLGDPNGIGPEIILKIFSDRNFVRKNDLAVAGSRLILNFYSSALSLPEIPSSRIIEISLPAKYVISPGSVDKHAGKIAGDSIVTAAKLCLSGKFDGMVTLPVSKQSLNLGGYKYPGHTEMLANVTSSGSSALMMMSEKFSVGLATGHVPVSKIRITSAGLFEKLVMMNNSLVKDFGIRNPSIALLSLNPHAGDGGVTGKEEENIILPLISEMNSIGFKLRGPFPADGYFSGRLYERFDLTVAMYHDQGMIPFKMLSFGKGVNFTAGLKILRTSPDHGTAFDIAGAGIGNPSSTVSAIELLRKIISYKDRAGLKKRK